MLGICSVWPSTCHETAGGIFRCREWVGNDSMGVKLLSDERGRSLPECEDSLVALRAMTHAGWAELGLSRAR